MELRRKKEEEELLRKHKQFEAEQIKAEREIRKQQQTIFQMKMDMQVSCLEPDEIIFNKQNYDIVDLWYEILFVLLLFKVWSDISIILFENSFPLKIFTF